jgi:hypothetical protein
VDRVTHGARGDERRAQYPSSARSTPRAQTKDSGLPPRTGQYRPSGSPAPRVATVRASEERYRPGGRRTSAEPLRASWQPKSDGEERPARARKQPPPTGKLAKISKTYGWRAYAVPILVVLTVLIVFRTASSPAEPIASEQQTQGVATTGSSGDTAAGDSAPVVGENPAKPVDLNIPTAVLPEGGDFTQAGAGTYHVLPVPAGAGKRVGTTGTLYTYVIEVENGIDASSYGGDDAFAGMVEATLSNKQSWTGSGKISLQRVDASNPAPSFRVSLTTPETDHRADVCGFSIKYESSCYRSSFGKRVVINLARWVRGALAYGPDIGTYRQYAINHEVGHALGNKHQGCPENGAFAPVMMQQSFGVANNYVADLNKVDSTNYSAVPADGKVCKVNPWPNP